MEKESGRARGGIKIFGRILSDAFQHARQSEIDVLAKRGVRERYHPDGGSPAHLRDSGSRDENLLTRVNGGLRTILRCCSEANRHAAQSEVDVLARRRYRVFLESDSPGADVHATGETTGDAGERTPREENRGHSFPGPAQMESSLPDGF